MADDVAMEDMDIDFDDDPEIAQLKADVSAMKPVCALTHASSHTKKLTPSVEPW